MKVKTNSIAVLVSILFCFLTVTSNAQLPDEPCAVDAMVQSLYLNEPLYPSLISDMHQKIFQNIDEYQSQTVTTVKTIPVVVHVIHDNGPENISDAQVQEAIVQLNEDFRKIPGTPGYGNGVDTEIQFELAKRDPNGICTNGILHVQSPHTIHWNDGYGGPNTLALYSVSRWPNDRYLNIYVVCDIIGFQPVPPCPTVPNGVLGYTWLVGYITGTIPAIDAHDGIVICHQAFGRTGTAAPYPQFNRVLSHEAGHWLMLWHTYNPAGGICFNSMCGYYGDYTCDTPPQMQHSSCVTTTTT